MTTATLSGLSVRRMSVHLGALGAWWVNCQVDQAATLSGSVTAALAGLTLTGTIAGGGPSRGTSRYRVVGGAGGWSSTLARRSYANDLGVKASKVLGDAAAEVGETLANAPSTSLGPAYTREEGPAGRLLNRIAPAWYVDEAGVTRIGKRSGVEIPGDAVRTHVDLERGVIELAAADVSTILPGATIDGVEIVDVFHDFDGAKLRTTVYLARAGATSREVEAFRQILDALDPGRRFRGLSEYRIVSQVGERFDLQIVRRSTGMPDLRSVRALPGVAGVRADAALGARVLVGFVDADASRPVVLAWEDAEGGGFAPTRLDLVGEDDIGVDPAGAVGRVVRYGDPITFSAPGAGVVALPAIGSLSRVRA